MEAFEILLPLALILCLTKLLGLGSHKIGMPAVIGMLIAGVLIGLIQYIPMPDEVKDLLFSDEIMSVLKVFAKIGVVLIMFSTGLGTDLKQLKSAGKASVVITAFGVVVPMGLGFLVSWLFFPDQSVITHLFYGAILTATSVSVTVATLKELGKLNTPVGTAIVAAAVIDDIIGIVILSVLTGFVGNTGAVVHHSFLPDWWTNAEWWLVCLKILAFFAIAIGLGLPLRKLFNKMEHLWPHNRRVPILAICAAFLYAYVAEKFFGVADITGAYIAGLVLGGTLEETPYVELKADILGYMFFSPIFFANIGMTLDFGGLNDPSFVFFGLCYVLVAIVGKLGGCTAAGLLCKFDKKDSFRIGCGMMVRAEVILICTEKGIAAGLVNSAVYPFIFMIIIITSVLAPVFLKLSYKNDNPLSKTPVENQV